MTEKETTSGGAPWRKRTVVAATAAAALAAGTLAFAGAAAAAPLPTLTLTAPATIDNSGGDSAGQTLTATFSNSAVGGLNTTGDLKYTFTGIPAGVTCTNVKVDGNASTTVGSTCVYDAGNVTVAASTTPTVHTDTITVDTTSAVNPDGLTGTISSQATFSVPSPNGNASVVTSNTASSTLTAPGAPSALGAAPSAIVYKAYSFKQFNVGTPVATPTVTVTNAGSVTIVAGANDGSVFTCPAGSAGAASNNCYHLNDGLFFDAVDGTIQRPANTAYAVDLLPPTYRISETNATATSGGTATATVTIPVLFSDVPTTNPFYRAIYSLGHANVIGGYLDGTFRPGTAVTRQAFAHFLYTGLTLVAPAPMDGPCSPLINPSAFADVPNSSQFCTSINYLAGHGVINGYSDGKFKPALTITRQALAAMLFRQYNIVYANGTGADAVCTSPTGFNDVTTSNPFCGDIEFLAQQGYVKGYTDGGYHPAASSSRQAVAQLIYTVNKSNGVAYPYARRG